MHTIPQNVTSYEDKIVGMFVGRQFIYLAVGGLTAFILLSTGGGASVVFRFLLAFGAIALAAAMALVKVNDRGFDVWLLGYAKAILGPTEWAWQKQEPLMEVLTSADKNLSAMAIAKTTAEPMDTYQFNVDRKEAFKDYVAGSSKDLDQDEQSFLAQLNFSEPIPRGSSITLSSQTAAPPMLTPQNPQKQVVQAPIEIALPAAKPIAALAQSTVKTAYTFTLGGHEQSVSVMQNQRANRSLSRQLLSGGAIPVPVRGELRLNLDPAYQQELTNLIGFAPETTSAPLFAMASQPMQPASPTSTSDDVVIPAPTAPTSVVTPIEPAADDTMNSKLQVAADWQAAADNRQKLNIQTAPPTPTLEPVVTTPEPATPPSAIVDSAGEVPASTVAASNDTQPVDNSEEAQLRQQLATFEDLARRAQAQLEEERRSRQELEVEMTKQESDAAVLALHYQDELSRLEQRSQEVANQGQAAKEHLSSLQQQAEQNPAAVDPAAVQQQQTLVDKLQQEEHRSAAFARELIGKMQSGQTAPVAQPAAVVTDSPAVATPQPLAVAPQNLPQLTTVANTINGFVFGADGQFVDGAVVVIKDDSGEAKRALKTNKLGQFVVTTPLANGHYMIEADKKGLAIDALSVELTGQAVPPLVIQSKLQV